MWLRGFQAMNFQVSCHPLSNSAWNKFWLILSNADHFHSTYTSIEPVFGMAWPFISDSPPQWLHGNHEQCLCLFFIKNIVIFDTFFSSVPIAWLLQTERKNSEVKADIMVSTDFIKSIVKMCHGNSLSLTIIDLMTLNLKFVRFF